METAAPASAMVTISRISRSAWRRAVSKKITNEDVLAFAELSGDVNPVHLSDDFAASTIFKKRIAHGFLTGSLFSTVLGTKLPGPGCIYLSQSMKFRAPVYIGDEVVATLKITALDPDKARATLGLRLRRQRQDRARRRGGDDGRPHGPRANRARSKDAMMDIVRSWQDVPGRSRVPLSPSAISTASIAATRRFCSRRSASPTLKDAARAPWCSSRTRARSSRPTSRSST